MSKICALCGKGSVKSSTYKKVRSKYNPTGQHFQKPNLQKVKLANGKTIQVCSRCRKKIKNQIAQ
ncbi:MAG TPA: L28 family ribosomal protein [Candidatus Paceibacterota bacterium]|jgi:ribosomal protein L28|nr:L28 family ribosomal protein [Candidatus Paceibacterota bacterium]HOQ15344.1 L28 family ribosomal protein [Candidatus Paceibacterota bacterium]HPQ22780.1 L28 family ribosomal protein [Candidatus Paceibacterota bacterium]HRR45666.1 L28 family ribosomal protein [Candidatus Paceibacterota bacterium]